MNKITASNKFVLMIATMLPAIMLATSLTLSLVPVTAFAQEEIADSDNESDIRETEEGDNSVTIDPIVQTSNDVDMNVDVNTDVITDGEDCDEASSEESQENDQDSSQEARSDGDVGDNSIFVSPQVQTTTLVAGNVYADVDIVPEGCNPTDTVNQSNDQESSQSAGGEVEAGTGSTIEISTHQIAETIAFNHNINTDATIPSDPLSEPQ
jgi:hypothetical protein